MEEEINGFYNDDGTKLNPVYILNPDCAWLQSE